MDKKWIITASSLVIIGMILLLFSGCSSNWDITKFSTVKYETTVYEVNESFSDISIKTDTDDIVFLPSDNEKCTVVCYESEKLKHSVSAADGVLTIDILDTRKWYDHISINFKTYPITVYLPEEEYAALTIKESTGDINIPNDFTFKNIDISVSTGDIKCYASAAEDIKISSSTGDICVENLSARSLDLSVSTGDVTVSDAACEGDITIGVSTGKTYLTNITCKNLSTNGNTGHIFLNNVIASEKFSISRSTGDVKFEASDAAEIFIETDTGNIDGSLLTDKVFIARSDTGDIDVPNSVTGGRCEMITDTGDIKVTVG